MEDGLDETGEEAVGEESAGEEGAFGGAVRGKEDVKEESTCL